MGFTRESRKRQDVVHSCPQGSKGVHLQTVWSKILNPTTRHHEVGKKPCILRVFLPLLPEYFISSLVKSCVLSDLIYLH